MKDILITGGAGFIGTNLIRRLIGQGHKITVLDNFNFQIHEEKSELADDIKDRITLINGSVIDADVFYSALEDRDCVIHLAAETGTGQSMYSVSHYTNINVQGTAILCDYIINEPNKLDTVILASSRSIYGEGKYKSSIYGAVYPDSRNFESVQNSYEVTCPISGIQNLILAATDERSLIHPSSFYGITKQVQEQMLMLACRMKKVNAYALRLQNVYGPGQSLKNPYTGILSLFSLLALKNEKISVFEDGFETRDFVYIDDVVDSVFSCLENDKMGQYILNVGSGLPTTILEVAKEIVSYLDSRSEIEISGLFREGDIRHNFADLTQIKSVLNFSPKWKFRDGLHNFLDWVLTYDYIDLSLENYNRSITELDERGLLIKQNKI